MDKSKIFGSAGVQPREVTFADGSTHQVHFRKVGSLERTRFIAASRSRDPEVIASGFMRLVMLSLCDASGNQALTWEEVNAVDEEVYDQFVGHAYALNSVVEKKTSPSIPASGTGTS